ncbi:substrate-binding domain-containing protein [Tenacibaculum agarivorans]|uniref:substrate-binding domain-containing protein n=1 Tax=Tenacibaculum agarivorans TaxID=1908389 RepID=UPI0009F85D17|nr:substrate-binding domain-containing protein [Tenacibaculum agarivorans]
MKTIIKRAFLVLLSLIILGCENSNGDKEFIIGFSQFSSNKNWKKAVVQSMQIEAGFHGDTKLLVVDSESDVDKQIADIENFIAQNVDAIIVSPIAPKPLRAIINKALNKKIPVIVLDREIDKYSTFIGVDNYEVGVNAGKFFQSLKKELNIAEIKGWAGTTPTKQKSKGFNTYVNKYDNLNVVAAIQDSYDGSGIKEKLKKLLVENKNIDYIFAHSDELAYEAYTTLKDVGLVNSIKLVGVGGLNAENGGIDLVQKDILEATILNSTGGKEAFKTAIELINGKTVEKQYKLPSVVVDATNVELLNRQLSLIHTQELDIEKQQFRIDEQIQLYKSQSQFLIATLIFLGIIISLLIITFLAKRKLTKQKRLLVKLIDQIDSQKKEIEQIAEDLRITNETTNNFFTGVSHDFKTPISLILSSTESLIISDEFEKPKEFNLIYNNSKRLLRMINQLLDFRRVESRNFKLKASKTNLESFVSVIFSDFTSEAQKKEIDFNFHSELKEKEVFIDRDLFDNVLFNLISNAFKFTPLKGEVKVSLQEDSKNMFITVKDSGIGIPDNEKEKIFNQFYQGSNNKQSSSGIGLYLTKEYIKLHGGSIKVDSRKNEGAEFIIRLPKGKSHLKPEEIVITGEIEKVDVIKETSFIDVKTTNKEKKEKETLLIIEDNIDLRDFLKTKLSELYIVRESDGIEVEKTILEVIPDIIISDVNLPQKSGFEICDFVKKDERTSHIPVLILTALGSDEAHIKGLKSGVDMFLTKPFNLSVLFQSLETLLYNRKKLQKHFKESLDLSKVTVVKTKSKEKKNKETAFINKIDELITKNLDDSTFTVEILAEELGISRVQLYRKIKAVLGITISDYIQNIKLERGKEMLLNEPNLSIADIAYSVGFSSPNYFSTAFKNKYNKTPNQFKKA